MLEPSIPTIKSPEFVQREFVPVTNATLFEESALRPITPPLLLTPLTSIAPFEITTELLEPSIPTIRSPEFVQRELVPVTNATLFEESAFWPITLP